MLYSNVCRTERSNSGIIDDGHAKEVSISNGDILSYIELQALLDEINRQSKRPLLSNVPIDYVKSHLISCPLWTDISSKTNR